MMNLKMGSIYHVYACVCLFDQDLLLRVPIHEIATVCYIRDDDLHIIGIKFGQSH